MKKILFLTISALFALNAGAQGIERERSSLARPDGYGGARVEITEEPDAARAIAAADRVARKDKVAGYRVSLFRDNSQTAGENARSVAEQFKARFPGIPVKVEYESPYFKVTAGNFVDKIDAITLCGKALPYFRIAVVVQEEISVADIVAGQKTAYGEDENKSGSDGI